ncbi:MAG TPA: alpha/beta-type small acid-soluble spore protein [Firmicutes bacterium]|nr:alpha/beta-type small acid-soluble spore protein [Bacillota bacterium]
MARGQKRNRALVVEAGNALDQWKYEIANEINFPVNQIVGGYWGNIPSAQCGAVGGHMVKRMIEAAERSLVEQSALNVRAGFRAGLGASANLGTTTGAYNLPSGMPAQQNVGQQAGFTTTGLQQ